MAALEIKEEFKDTQVGFNDSGLPLRLRSDLHILAKIAIEGNDENLLNMFKTRPTLEDVTEQMGEAFLAANPVAEDLTTSKTPKANGKTSTSS